MRIPILYTALLLLAISSPSHARVATPTNISNNNSLQFIENKGQIVDQNGKHRNDIDFKLETPGMNVFIGKGQIHYQWNQNLKNSKNERIEDDINSDIVGKQHSGSPNRGSGGSVETYRLDVTLIGANPNAQLIVEEKTGYFENYYLPQCPDGATAHSYKKITYKNVYPNIDWVLYTNQQSLKYDFVVRPGGNVHNIKPRYDGATTLVLKDGALIATTPFGTITENAPYSYDAITKQEISSAFVIKENVVSFKIAVQENTLIIDPDIIWGTYYGGSGISAAEGCADVACDTADNSYIAGIANSTNNIATTGAYQTTLSAADVDGFIAKFNSAGVRQWGTYYGTGNATHSTYDQLHSILVDVYGDIYVSGTFQSSTIATTPGSHQPLHGGNVTDCILIKLKNTGTRVWATYYGGSNWEDQNTRIASDKFGNVYLISNTQSTNAISTAGSHQSSKGNNVDGFLAKFDSSGARQWSTYYGGSGYDYLYCVTTDNWGNVYIGGESSSPSGIATSGSFISTYVNQSGFFVKFNANGVRQWGSYFPGQVHDMVCDKKGNLFISGRTNRDTSVATPGSYQTVRRGIADAFFVKFDSVCVRKYGTYFGGENDDACTINLDTAENVILSGQTFSSYFISTLGSHQPLRLNSSTFIARFDTAYKRRWGTYYGSATTDGHVGQCNIYGDLYFTGTTTSLTGIATPGAHQTTKAGNNTVSDGFLAKFHIKKTIYIETPFNDTALCPGDTIKLAFGMTYDYGVGNIVKAQLSDSAGNFVTPVQIGTKTSAVPDTVVCIIPTNTFASKKYRIRLVASNPADTSSDNGINIGIGRAPDSLTAVSNSPVCVGDTIHLIGVSKDTGVIYTWIGPSSYTSGLQSPNILNASISRTGNYILSGRIVGCFAKDTVFVQVNPLPGIPSASNSGPICNGDTLKLFATDTSTNLVWSWVGPNSFSASTQNPTINNASMVASGTYTVTGAYSSTGCFRKDTTNVTVKPLPVNVNASSNSSICANDSLKLFGTTTSAGVSYKWNGPGSFTSAAKDTAIANAQTTHSGNYILTVTLNGCTTKDTEAVLVKPLPNKPTAASNTPVCPATSLNLTAAPTTGASYSWTGPGGYSAATQSALRTNMITAWAGNYIVTATLNGCIQKDTETVAVTVTTPTPIATNNSPVCVGGILNLSASAITGATYSWTGPGGYTSTGQNTVRNNMQVGDAGTYAVTANVNGCISLAGTTTATVVTGPQVNVYVNPSDTLCAGDTAKFVALPFNAGASPTYQWYRNGNPVSGATMTPYSTNAIGNGDVFFVRMTATTGCNTPIQSNSITMNVLPVVGPSSVKINVLPDSNVWPGVQLTFTANTVNCNDPKYQWRRNGIDIVGGTINPLFANHYSDGDVVSCVVTCKCGDPKAVVSNGIKLKVDTRVGDPGSGSGMTSVVVYPNPTTGDLTLTFSIEWRGDVRVELRNLLGQIVLKQDLSLTTYPLRLNISNLPAGTYMLQLQSEDGYRVNVKVVKE
jgi:hypothetical protein